MRTKNRLLILSIGLAVLVIFALTSCMQNAEIIGHVADNNGNAVQDATVQLLQGTKVIRQTKTDTNGDYMFSPIEEGTYKVRATKDGYNEALSGFFTTKMYGTTNAPQLTLTPYTGNKYNIYGVVSLLDKGDGEWDGIKVELKHDSMIVKSTTTDASGNYYFNGINEGDNYSITFSKAGYETTTKTFNLHGDSEINVTLKPSISSDDLGELINIGKEALYHGDVAYAEQAFKLAYAKDPTSIDANVGYSITYGSTEIELAVQSTFAFDTAMNMLKKTPFKNILSFKDTPYPYTEPLQSLLIKVLDERSKAANYSYNHADKDYSFDIDDDDGSLFVSIKQTDIQFYKFLLDSLGGIPRFLLDHFNFYMDVKRIENAFEDGNGFADLDENHDGIITPEELFGSEFLKLKDGTDINSLDYESALKVSLDGVKNMLSVTATTISDDELLSKLGTSDLEDLLSELSDLMSGPITINGYDWANNPITLEINFPALFNNSNKIDDWKKLLPNITLIKTTDESDNYDDGGDDGLEKAQKFLKSIVKDYDEDSYDSTPTFYEIPDIVSKHAYDFDAGKDWLFGSNGLFPTITDQWGLLDLLLPPEIYGWAKDKDNNLLENSTVMIGIKSELDAEISNGQPPDKFQPIPILTGPQGYYAIPTVFLGESATQIYVTVLKLKNMFSAPATGDLVGIYATDYDYGGITEIATPGVLMEVLTYMKPVDVANMISNKSDVNASAKLIPIDFSITSEASDSKPLVSGRAQYYDGSNFTYNNIHVTLICHNDTNSATYNTITDEDGNYAFWDVDGTINGFYSLVFNKYDSSAEFEIDSLHYYSEMTTIYATYGIALGNVSISAKNVDLSKGNAGIRVTRQSDGKVFFSRLFQWNYGDGTYGDSIDLPYGTYDVSFHYFNAPGQETPVQTKTITLDSDTDYAEITFDLSE